jgi:hypothetical protein
LIPSEAWNRSAPIWIGTFFLAHSGSKHGLPHTPRVSPQEKRFFKQPEANCLKARNIQMKKLIVAGFALIALASLSACTKKAEETAAAPAAPAAEASPAAPAAEASPAAAH